MYKTNRFKIWIYMIVAYLFVSLTRILLFAITRPIFFNISAGMEAIECVILVTLISKSHPRVLAAALLLIVQSIATLISAILKIQSQEYKEALQKLYSQLNEFEKNRFSENDWLAYNFRSAYINSVWLFIVALIIGGFVTRLEQYRIKEGENNPIELEQPEYNVQVNQIPPPPPPYEPPPAYLK